ncbi:MAG TPA: hypothetical protein VKS21_11920 [Spirochaetota bacterium]|nr:hypothetical protein [Spirochaetota bacterium]
MAEYNNDFLKSTAAFIRANSKQILITISALLVIALGYYIYHNMRLKKEKKLAGRMFDLQNDALLAEYQAEEEKFKRHKKKLIELANKNFSYTAGKRAWYWSAEMERQDMQYTNAAAKYKRLFQEAPGFYLSPAALYKCALCYTEIGEFQKAVTWLEKFDVKYENNFYYPQAQLLLAHIYRVRQDFSSARQTLKSLEKKIAEENASKMYGRQIQQQLSILKIKEKQSGTSRQQAPASKAQPQVPGLPPLN